MLKYRLHLGEGNMNKNYQRKKEALHDYYEKNELVLIGMNDYANSSFLTNSLLRYIEKEIGAAVLNVDAGSLTLNKTEHLDIMLEYNLTLEEIKIARLISIHDGISNLVRENFGRNVEKKVDTSILEPLFRPSRVKTSKIDSTLEIGTLIEEAKSPIIIHSSGANNLMRILGTNPYIIEHDYRMRSCNDQYRYALSKASNPKTVEIVLDGVKRNFENILDLNPNAQIFSLGLYLQKVFKKEKFETFKQLILSYNEALSELCKQYDVNYVSTMIPGNEHENHVIDFNLSQMGQKALAKSIVEALYDSLEAVSFEKEYKEMRGIAAYKDKEMLLVDLKKAQEKNFEETVRNVKDEIERADLVTLNAIQTLLEKNREVKIYQKTFEEVKRRNPGKCV